MTSVARVPKAMLVGADKKYVGRIGHGVVRQSTAVHARKSTVAVRHTYTWSLTAFASGTNMAPRIQDLAVGEQGRTR